MSYREEIEKYEKEQILKVLYRHGYDIEMFGEFDKQTLLDVIDDSGLNIQTLIARELGELG